MHKKLEREIVLIEFGFLFYREIKIWEKVIRYVVQNNRKCLQKSSSLRIHPVRNRIAFTAFKKLTRDLSSVCCFLTYTSNGSVVVFNKRCGTRPK